MGSEMFPLKGCTKVGWFHVPYYHLHIHESQSVAFGCLLRVIMNDDVSIKTYLGDCVGLFFAHIFLLMFFVNFVACIDRIFYTKQT